MATKPFRWNRFRKAVRSLMEDHHYSTAAVKQVFRDKVFDREGITELTLETPNAAVLSMEISEVYRDIDDVAKRIGHEV